MKSAKKIHVDRNTIVTFLNETLNIKAIEDASCNGLQVQGAKKISRVALAVDACMEAYTQAVAQNCQMVIAHHGIIWRGISAIIGSLHAQIRYLINNELNLYAAHLPLDLHPALGNNAELARIIGLTQVVPFGNYKGTLIGFEGVQKKPITLDTLSQKLARALGSTNTVLPFGTKSFKRIAIVSGGAAGELGEAIEKGVECYITGEPGHANHHAAKEAGINVIYCGHYHSETVGVKALGPLLEKRFGVKTVFLDIPTIV